MGPRWRPGRRWHLSRRALIAITGAVLPCCAANSSPGADDAVEFRADATLADALILGEHPLPDGSRVRFVEAADHTQLCATIGLGESCLPTPGARPSTVAPTFVQSASTFFNGTIYMLGLPPEFPSFTVQDDGGGTLPSGRSTNGDYAVFVTAVPEAPLLPLHLVAEDRQELATLTL